MTIYDSHSHSKYDSIIFAYSMRSVYGFTSIFIPWKMHYKKSGFRGNFAYKDFVLKKKKSYMKKIKVIWIIEIATTMHFQ